MPKTSVFYVSPSISNDFYDLYANLILSVILLFFVVWDMTALHHKEEGVCTRARGKTPPSGNLCFEVSNIQILVIKKYFCYLLRFK